MLLIGLKCFSIKVIFILLFHSNSLPFTLWTYQQTFQNADFLLKSFQSTQRTSTVISPGRQPPNFLPNKTISYSNLLVKFKSQSWWMKFRKFSFLCNYFPPKKQGSETDGIEPWKSSNVKQQKFKGRRESTPPSARYEGEGGWKNIVQKERNRKSKFS